MQLGPDRQRANSIIVVRFELKKSIILRSWTRKASLGFPASLSLSDDRLQANRIPQGKENGRVADAEVPAGKRVRL